MAQVHLHIPSFNAGELSPLLGARFAVEKIGSGCRRLRNFIPHVHGPAFRRPGFEYIGPARSRDTKSKLFAFSFSTTTNFMLEFNPAGLGVWSNGVAVPLVNEVALPYSEQECQELQLVQVNDVCYIVHANHAPRQLTRFADDDWRLAEIPWDWPPMGDENVRPDVITTPTTTEILNVPTEEWPEFTLVAGSHTLRVTNPDTSGFAKSVHLERWTGTSWASVEIKAWGVSYGSDITFTATAGIHRLRRNVPGIITATSVAQVLSGATVIGQLDLGIFQPAENKTVIVAAGDWQVVVDCTTVPADGVLWLQKQNSGGTWVNHQRITLVSGQQIITRMPALLASTSFRFNWTGRAMTGGTAAIEQVTIPVVTDVTLACSATSGTGRTLTASEAVFKPGHVGSYWQITHRRDNSTAQIVSAVPTISAATSNEILVSGKWQIYSYGIWTSTLLLERKVGATWEIVRSWVGRSDRNVIADGEEIEPSSLRLRVLAGTSAAASGAAVPRFVLECTDAKVDGLARVTEVGTLDGDGRATEATVDVISGLYSTAATAIWTEGAFSEARGFPRAIALHAGRLWFSGVIAEPSRVWGSVVADFLNHRRSSYDDAAISVTPASQSSNVVQWMASFETRLVLGTKADEWTLSAAGDSIKPTDIQMLRRSSYGSAPVSALIVGDALVFVQRGGRRMRQISPRSEIQEWSAVDLTVLAEHIGQLGFTSLAVMTAPQVILWAVTADGKLAGMTFEREQNVFGWHLHTTLGAVESVAVIRGNTEDELWISVLRAGGRFIERLDTRTFARDFSEPEKLVYLDSAKRLHFETPQITLTGLAHLALQNVSVVVDGVEQGGTTIFGGDGFDLDEPASDVVVGLPFESELQPMRVEVPMRDGTAQNRRMKLSRVGLYLHASNGGTVSFAQGATLEPIPYPDASLFTGDMEVPVGGAHGDNMDVFIRTGDAYPLNVGCITLKGDVYGD